MMTPINLVKAIPTPYMLLALAALVAGAIGFGYVKGRSAEADKHTEYVRQITEANAKLEAKNAQIMQESKRINAETVAGWSAAVDYLRANPVRVRRPDGHQPPVPAVSGSAGSTEPATGERRSGAGSGEAAEVSLAECQARLDSAVKDAAQVMWLLDWAAGQREAGAGSWQ